MWDDGTRLGSRVPSMWHGGGLDPAKPLVYLKLWNGLNNLSNLEEIWVSENQIMRDTLSFETDERNDTQLLGVLCRQKNSSTPMSV